LLASEAATTSKGRGRVTIAIDRLVVDLQNVGGVDILGAVNKTNASAQVELSLLATVGPVKIGIPAMGSGAGELARCVRCIRSEASAGEGSGTRDPGTISADTITATSVVLEDAISSRVDRTLALVDLATVDGRLIAIVIVGTAGVRAITSTTVAKVLTRKLSDSDAQEGVGGKSQA
jgi:hypothetical protein